MKHLDIFGFLLKRNLSTEIDNDLDRALKAPKYNTGVFDIDLPYIKVSNQLESELRSKINVLRTGRNEFTRNN